MGPNKHISRYDFTAVYTHPEARADVVLVHGLNGDPQRTWTAANGVFWPADLLPASLGSAHANVLVYGYNADVYSSRHGGSASSNFLHHHAQTLVTALTHYRKSEDSLQRPLVWVAHSLGGILAKTALLYASDLRDEHHVDYRSVYVSTYAVVFLGTPHSGTDVAAWGHILQTMSDAVLPRRFFESEPVLLKTLKKDSETLQNINSHFLDIYQRFMIHMAHENHKTDIKGTKTLIVPSLSASPPLPGVTYYGIEATHSGMCKFDSASAPGYRIISTAIREWVVDAPPVIQVRWLVELEGRDARARLELRERRIREMRPSPAQSQILGKPPAERVVFPPTSVGQSPLSEPETPQEPPVLPCDASQNDPPFIHPEPFRPNSFFVGRQDELKRLHKMLTDRTRRSQGTSAVLIQCLPGGGKSHLARQYVFQYRHHYPGGVFWVRAKSRLELEHWFLLMADEIGDDTKTDKKDVTTRPRDRVETVDFVRRWLSGRPDWLLVLDGIHFDIPDVHQFVPDARNTSLIYTSTERAVAGDYQFDNPQVMELALPSAAEAQELLLLEMEKKPPWTHDDRARALELVQLMGRLPQMIHVAAQHLKATREPLSKYLRSYRNRPKAGGLPAYRAVRDQLRDRGATEALNLVSILVFFDQHIPVEMLTLGLSALDNRTPVKSRDDASPHKSSLGNTVAVLISFALLQRTEGDGEGSSGSSGSSRRSLDRNTNHLDLLRIHSVVQAFFIDTLAEQREAHFWLERAAAVWCRSLDRADEKVQHDARIGRPDDYRRYAIHGRRLADNLGRFEKRSPEWLRLARAQIELRLARIDREIDRMSHLQTNQESRLPPTSVFERASSASESDSVTSPSGHTDDTDCLLEEAPIPLASVYGHDDYVPNPYHWHVPYPSLPTMPDEDDTRTIIGATTSSARPVTPGFLQPPPNPAHHRSVRRAERRRDRAPWRDSSVGDSRVSISREVARGTMSGVGGRGRWLRSRSAAPLTAESEAELHLHKIKAASPLLPYRGSSLELDDDTKSSTVACAPSRPRLILGSNSYAKPSATLTPEHEYSSPTGFSTSTRPGPSPLSWTAATVKRLQDAAGSPQTGELRRGGLRAGDTEPPGPLFRGSPSIPNPNPHPRLLPIRPSTSPPRHRHRPRRKTQAYHPSPELLASGYPQDPMSLSFPLAGGGNPNPNPSARPRPLSWGHDPGGFLSPQSYPGSPRQLPVQNYPYQVDNTLRPSSPAFPRGSVNLAHPVDSPLDPLGRRHRFFSLRTKFRRPSHTETEPSPRIAAMDPTGAQASSYRSWEDRYFLDGASSNPASRYASPAMSHPSPSFSPPLPPLEPLDLSPSWLLSDTTIDDDDTRNGDNNSLAQPRLAPILQRLGRGRGRTRRIRPSLFLAQRPGNPRDSSVDISSQSLSGGRTASAGFAPASSAPGGFMLADGQVVEFGDVAPGKQRLKRRSRRPAARVGGLGQTRSGAEAEMMELMRGEMGLGIRQDGGG